MRRHDSLIPLSHDHHMTLLLCQVLKKDGPVYQDMSKDPKDKAGYIKTHYDTHLVKHFNVEENILFPFIKGRNAELDSLVEELISDHRKIAEGIKALDTQDDLVEGLDQLGEMIDAHIRKEERELFEKIPRVFPEEELKQLEAMIPKSDF